MKSNTNHVTNDMDIPVYCDIFNTYNSQLGGLILYAGYHAVMKLKVSMMFLTPSFSAYIQ
jgi:hypothetical protein